MQTVMTPRAELVSFRTEEFQTWKALVNARLDRTVGLVADDLPDCPYWDWFIAGKSPASAAREAVRRAEC